MHEIESLIFLLAAAALLAHVLSGSGGGDARAT